MLISFFTGVECDRLSLLPHASVVNVNGSRRHYPDKVEIQCDTGYTVAQEHSSLNCQGDGTWFNAARGCTSRFTLRNRTIDALMSREIGTTF